MTQTDGTAAATPARRRNRWNATDLGLIAVFAALVAGSALIAAIPVGGLGVPITLQTLAVMLTGLALGPGRAFAAVGLYVLLGLAGLPIFSGGRSGLGVLAGPSAGYIIGFVFAATAVGWLTVVVLRRTAGRPGKLRAVLLFAAAMVSSIIFIHGLGILGNDGQREAGLLQGVPRRPGLLPRRCDQERTGRDRCAGPAQGIPGSADPPGPDCRDCAARRAATPALGAGADSRP